jgi:Bacterial Ig-like domain (group 3)
MYSDILNDNKTRVLTTSFSCTEVYDCSTAVMDSRHAIFNKMVGMGWTLIASSGDRGAADNCWDNLPAKPAPQLDPDAATSVAYPASDNDFVAAGGTQLYLNSDGTWNAERAWQGGFNIGSCAGNGGGSGGGVSVYYPQPYWQKPLNSLGSMRLTPDISLNALGIGQNEFINGGMTGDANGTSVSAPELAGFFAQENTYLNYIGDICGSKGNAACTPVGNPNPFIYEDGIGGGQHDPFYNMLSGCNSSDATQQEHLKFFCAGPGYSLNQSSGAQYNLVSGWGSANMMQLAWGINWELIPAYGSPSIAFSGPAVNKWYNTNQTVSWVVKDAGSSGLPAPGVAGFTQGWDSIPADPYSEPHGGTGNSFYTGPEYPFGQSGCLAFENNGCSGGAGQGCHVVQVEGWDNQGNTALSSYGPLCFDDVAPVTTVVTSPSAPNSNGWYNTAVTISIAASDPGGSGASGVGNIYYALGTAGCTTSTTGSCSTYSSTITVNTQEAVGLTTFSKDKAGNFSAVVNRVIAIDTTPPATTAGFSGVLSSGVWENSVTVTLKATDNLSGAAATYYTIDGGAKITYSTPFKTATVGSHTLDYWSVDQAGNAEKANVNTFKVASSTTTTLTAAPNPVLVGHSVTLKATVAGTDPGTPTGSVTFYNGSTPLGTVTLSAGVASLSISSLPAGSDTLTATYGGATYYLSGHSAAVVEVVNEATTTALTVTPNSPVYGSTVTLTAKVKASISGAPTGSVKFLNGATVLGSATLNSSDVALMTTKALSAGSNSITAIYSGDTTYLTSTSTAVTETITKAASATALKSSVTTTAYEEFVNLTATVTSTGGTPTGTVTFLSNGISIGTGTLAAGGFTLSTKALAVGANSVTASYGGSADFNTSTSAGVSVTIDKASTNPKVASSLNPSTVGASVTFTATVTSAVGPAPGTVTFMDGSTSLGTETLSGGKATLTTAALAKGTHPITVVYAGTADYAASTSSALTQMVDAVAAASRVVYVPDYYGQLLQVRVGTGTPAAITISLPHCNPNSVAVNSNKAYVACNANGSNPDKILVYNAATIRAAPAGTLTISPLQTITSTQFSSLIGITFDASNDLWVASYGNNQVDEITAAQLAATTPAVTASLINSPSSPVALAFDKNGSLWVTGQYGGGILLNFPSSQLGKGENANPDYCLATSNLGAGCQYVNGVFLGPEGLALFNGDVWVANNSTGAGGNVPGRELVDLKYSGGSATATGTLTVNATFGNSAVAADSPFVCPGGLFAGAVHLWVNDQSYGEANPQCGAAGDVASKTGGVFDFTSAQLTAKTTTLSQVLAYTNITGRPGFGGIFVENDQ